MQVLTPKMSVLVLIVVDCLSAHAPWGVHVWVALHTKQLKPQAAVFTLLTQTPLRQQRPEQQSLFAEQLFNLRQTLAGEYQAAAHIEALPTERGSPFSVHPGAVTYFDASETGFLEKYSDYLWLGLFGFGTIISIATWLFSRAPTSWFPYSWR